MGRRMVSREIREEGTEPPYPGLTSTPTHPTPDPCLHPGSLLYPRSTSLFCSTALPHVTGVQTASGATWCYQAFLGVCGRGQGAGVAEGPCGGSSPFFLDQQRSSNELELQLCPLSLALPWPAVAPHPHFSVSPLLLPFATISGRC